MSAQGEHGARGPTGPAAAWTMAAVLAVAAAARVPFLADSLWYDEIAAFLSYGVQGPAHALTTYFSLANHVLQSAVTAASAQALGADELSLRLPSLLAGLGAVGATWWFARVAVGGAVAPWAAAAMGPPVCPIRDFHTHVHGTQAAEVGREAADAFGVGRALTMVRRLDAAPLSRLLGDRLSFIAFPDFRNEDRGKAMREGFLDDIRAFHDEHGATIIKLWNAPRLREFFPDATGLDLIEFDGIWRVKQVELAQKLGMSVMVHVADPDTWFATRYSDPAKFGRKLDHYRGLEAMLTRFADVTWFAAHMGGYPERLDILDGLLERHPNLHIDTSATKWVLRELSNHPLPQLTAFFERWAGRILFGSDIVTTDEHMAPKASSSTHPMAT